MTKKMEISNKEIMDRMAAFVPELINMRNRIDEMLNGIESFSENKADDRDETIKGAILAGISETFDVSYSDLKSERRFMNLAKARHVYASMLYVMTKLSSEEVGQTINRDGSTIRNSRYVITKAEKERSVLWDLYQVVEDKVNLILKAVK